MARRVVFDTSVIVAAERGDLTGRPRGTFDLVIAATAGATGGF